MSKWREQHEHVPPECAGRNDTPEAETAHHLFLERRRCRRSTRRLQLGRGFVQQRPFRCHAQRAAVHAARTTQAHKHMLGYRTALIDCYVRVNRRHPQARNASALRNPILLNLIATLVIGPVTYSPRAQQPRGATAKGGIAELSSSGPQKRQGALTTADGDVDIRYGNQRLRADHVEYNDQTNEAIAKGNVQFDYENAHL